MQLPFTSLIVNVVWEILSYLARVEHSITLWGGATDLVDLPLLYQLVRETGADRVYVDVPFQYDPLLLLLLLLLRVRVRPGGYTTSSSTTSTPLLVLSPPSCDLFSPN